MGTFVKSVGSALYRVMAQWMSYIYRKAKFAICINALSQVSKECQF